MSSTLTAHVAAAVVTAPRSLRRIAVIRILGWFMAVSAILFGLLTVVLAVVGPGQEIHAFHNAIVASLLLILSAPPSIAFARSPERPMEALLVLAVLAIAGLATMALSLTLDPFTLPFVVVIGVLWAMRPRGEPLVPSGRPSAILLALVLAGTLPVLSYAWNQAAFQRIDTVTTHDAFFHWVEMSFYVLAVWMLAVLAALRPATSRLAAWTGGLALVVIGAASLLLEGSASAVPAPWGWISLAGGVLFIALSEWEARRADRFLALKTQM